MDITTCKNRRTGQYSLRKDGHLFLTSGGTWVEESSETTKIWETKSKLKAETQKSMILAVVAANNEIKG